MKMNYSSHRFVGMTSNNSSIMAANNTYHHANLTYHHANVTYHHANVTYHYENNTHHHTNNTYDNDSTELYDVLFRDLIFVAYIITFFFGVIGNTVVCYVLFHRKQKRKSIHLLTINLSLSDLIVSTIYLPMQMYLIITQLKWGLGDIMCRVFNGINSLTVNASIGTLVVITFDRYNAVVKPMIVHSRNTFMTKILIMIVWVSSFSLTIPLILAAKVKNGYCSEVWPNDNYEHGYWTLAFVLQFALPLIYISMTYIIIICTVKRSQSQFELVRLHDDVKKDKKRKAKKTGLSETDSINEKNNNNGNGQYTIPTVKKSCRKRRSFCQQSLVQLKRKKQQNKLLKMSIILVITYCVCTLPQHAVYFALSYSDFSVRPYSAMIFVLANFLMAVNSALNPIIYGTLNDEMKKGFKRMMTTSDNRLERNVSDRFSSFRETVRRRTKRTNTQSLEFSYH